MNKPDKKITEFILKHHVLTLATSADNSPWCANCFYVYSCSLIIPLKNSTSFFK